MYYIYIIRTTKNTLYTGITTDIERRMAEHMSGNSKGAKYTRSNPPKTLEAVWSCNTRSEASKIEAHIKTLKRQQKENIITDKTFSFFKSEICKREKIGSGDFRIIYENAEEKNENSN